MDIARTQAPPGIGERAARWAVVVFMLLAVVTLAFGLGFGVNELRHDDDPTGVANVPGQVSAGDSVGASILNEIYSILQNLYVDRENLDPELMREAAIDGVLNSLNDPHTTYLTPEEMKSGGLEINSSYQGIGASVTDRNGVVEIVAPFRESPAEASGIKAGDIILEVNGERTDGWSDQEAVQKIRGPRGTTVTLTVKHLSGATEKITITRGDINIESVFIEPRLEAIPGESGTKLVDRAGNEVTDLFYVNISQFHDKTLAELRQKLQNVERQNYKGIIVDVRSNPGGLLGATVDVVDEFLASGRILSERDYSGKESVWNARPGGVATKLPIAVLQDQASASGAEVLSAALRDNNRATIVGTRSFGKGTVNQLQELKRCGDPKGCGALYVATGRWYRPSGEVIEGIGILPDVEVPMTSDEYIEQGDIQLFRAIEVLRGQ